MSSINDALRRAGQMNEASGKTGSPVQQTPSFTAKQRPGAMLAVVLIVPALLVGAIGWFVLRPGKTNTITVQKARSLAGVKTTGEKVFPGSEKSKTSALLPAAPPGDRTRQPAGSVKTAVTAKKAPKASYLSGTSARRSRQPVIVRHPLMPKKLPQTLKKPRGRVVAVEKPGAGRAGAATSAAGGKAPLAPAQEEAALKHYKAGRAAQEEGRYNEAVLAYRQALRLNPRLTKAYLNLGNIFFFHDHALEKARRMYTRVLEIDPDNKLGHNNLGVIFLRKNLYNQAETEFSTALKLDPGFVNASYNMACLYAKKGMKAKAMARLLKAAQIEPAVRRWASGDNDLKNLAGLPEFERFLHQDGQGEHKAGKQ